MALLGVTALRDALRVGSSLSESLHAYAQERWHPVRVYQF